MGKRSKKILDGFIATKKIANGYLFLGGDNNSKLISAVEFAKALNCLGSPAPCDACTSCKKAEKGANPDIVTIEKDGASIKINQIRAIKELAKYGPAENPWQAIIINDAHTLTTEAANGFLKILEEPASNTVFILISNRIGSLLKTIESRCQKIVFEDSENFEFSKEAENLYTSLCNKKMDFIETSELLAQSKDYKSILQDLFSLFAISKNITRAKDILKTLQLIERRANPKLALDVLSYKLWKTN